MAQAAPINITEITVWFCGITVAVVVAEAACVWLARRGREKLYGDGIFVLHTWPTLVRSAVVLTIMTLGVFPLFIFVTALSLGGILGGIEGWSFSEGYEYVLCNMLGIGPLISYVPDTTIGILADILISCWAMLIGATILGLSAGLSITVKWVQTISPTVWGFTRALLLYVPIVMVLLSCITGGAIALMEEWSFSDGFLYMVGALCMIEDPLTQVAPDSDAGYFFMALCFVIETLLGGAVIGVIGSHKVVEDFMARLQGTQDAPEEEEEQPEDMPGRTEVEKNEANGERPSAV